MNGFKPKIKVSTLALRLMVAALLVFGCGLSLFYLAPLAHAQFNSYGFGPQAYKDGINYGNGIYFAPYAFTLYTQPDERSPKIGEFRWSRKTNSNAITATTAQGDRISTPAERLFFCFYPQLDVAMMAVVGENGDGWVEVVYDQVRQKTGWARLKDAPSLKNTTNHNLPSMESASEPTHFGVYQTWLEFMKLNAKASGVYWLNGVKNYHRSIRSADADDSKLIPVTIIRDLKVKHLRGNWLLVEVLDFERNTPIGWLRWRDDDGNLMVFPNINQQYKPIVITTYSN